MKRNELMTGSMNVSYMYCIRCLIPTHPVCLYVNEFDKLERSKLRGSSLIENSIKHYYWLKLTMITSFDRIINTKKIIIVKLIQLLFALLTFLSAFL